MKTLVFKIDMEQVPAGGLMFWIKPVKVRPSSKRQIALMIQKGKPVKVAPIGIACSSGCDCVARFGQN